MKRIEHQPSTNGRSLAHAQTKRRRYRSVETYKSSVHGGSESGNLSNSFWLQSTYAPRHSQLSGQSLMATSQNAARHSNSSAAASGTTRAADIATDFIIIIGGDVGPAVRNDAATPDRQAPRTVRQAACRASSVILVSVTSTIPL